MTTLRQALKAETPDIPDQVGVHVDEFVSWLDGLDEPIAGDGTTTRDVLAMSSGDFAVMASRAQG